MRNKAGKIALGVLIGVAVVSIITVVVNLLSLSSVTHFIRGNNDDFETTTD